jgi:hypothetical protein
MGIPKYPDKQILIVGFCITRVRASHAPLVREGCTHWKGHSAPRAHRSAARARWTPPSVCADLIAVRTTVIRCVKGLLALNLGESIRNPNSWWFGE